MSDTHEGAEVQGQQGAEVQSQQGAEVPSADHDPRPVFDGDWGKADGRARQAHLVRVNAWKRRHPEASQAVAADADVAAILGSGAGDARITPDSDLGLRTLRSVARDTAAPASARVTAASALRAAEAEAARTAAEDERARVTAALAAAPQGQRLLLLERIVRRHEPAGWVSVFASGQEGADPAGSAG